MRKCVFFLAACLIASCLAPSAWAQNTTIVSATITDPIGIPYSFATISAQLVPTGVTPTIPPPCNGQSSTPCVVSGFSSGTADATGTFSMNLASNAVLSPGGTQWLFTVNESPGIPLPFGTGPQSLTATLTISGVTQSISAALNALAPALTNFAGAGSVVCSTSRAVPFETSANHLGCDATLVYTESTANNSGGLYIQSQTSASFPESGYILQMHNVNEAAGSVAYISKSSNGHWFLDNLIGGTLYQSIDMFADAGHGLSFGSEGTNGFGLTMNGLTGTTCISASTVGSVCGGQYFLFDNLNHLITIYGSSGSASIGVPSTAGTPCTILLPTASPTAGQVFSAAAPSGGSCQGSWATALTNPMTTLGDIIYENATPAASRLAGPTAVNGVPQSLTSTPSSGAATTPFWSPAGVLPRVSTCPSNLDTIVATDRAGYVSWNDASACAVTLPQANSTGFASNFVMIGCDIGAGTATITPTTSTISYTNGSAYTSGAGSLPLTTGQCAWIYSDNTNYFAVVRSGSALSAITAALASNTIANGNNPQTWNWAQTTDAQDAITFGETSAAIGGTLTNGLANQGEVFISTASGSTATPLEVVQLGVTGATGPPLLQLESTWNNASLVGEGLLMNVTNTNSAAGSKLLDLRVNNTAQITVDKAGNEVLATSVATGTAPTVTAGTSGLFACTEGTAPTGSANTDAIYCNSNTHAMSVNNNNVDEGPALDAKRNLIWNSNQAAQSQVVVSGTEYYITHSDLDMPAVYRLAIGAGTTFHWRIALTKTAAGTGTFQILLKKGTNGSTADTTNATITVGTQTAVADNMECDVTITFTSATAYYYSVIPRQSAASGTGFGLVYPAAAAQFTGTVSGLTTTTASDKYGLSVVFTTGTPTFVVNEVFATVNGVI